MEFIFEPKHSSIPFLVLVPFGSSLCTLLVVAILLSCFMLVLTAGPVDSKGIQIDGNHYPSMYKCLGRAPKGSAEALEWLGMGFGHGPLCGGHDLGA